MHVVRFAIVPVLSAYALLAAVVVHAARHPEEAPAPGTVVGWPPRVRLIALTLGGGCACFLGIVLVFHVWIAGQREAMRSALRGGAFLVATCAVAFALGSAIEARFERGAR